MALFIAVDVAPELARDAASAKKLAEVCPVDIFKVGSAGALELVEKNLDECTLCELCLAVGKPGQVSVRKLYDDGARLERRV
jgi:NAD-dependent dihydropyrimidine dehydrogenase PreA subunit